MGSSPVKPANKNKSMEQRERIKEAILEGYDLKGIRLKSGNASKKLINEVMREIDPLMYENK